MGLHPCIFALGSDGIGDRLLLLGSNRLKEALRPLAKLGNPLLAVVIDSIEWGGGDMKPSPSCWGMGTTFLSNTLEGGWQRGVSRANWVRIRGMRVETVSVVASATVGVAAIAAASLSARGQRKHTERMATRERRSDAYLEILTAIRLYTAPVHRRSQVFSSPPPPGGDPVMTVQERARLNALAGGFGSKAVRDRLMDWSDALAKFYAKDDPAFANGSKQAKEAAQPVLAAVHALEKAARDDLLGTEEQSASSLALWRPWLHSPR